MAEKINLKVGFLTSTNPNNKRASSGVHYSMFNALRNEFTEVIPIGPAVIKKPLLWILKILGFIHLKFLGGEYNPWHSVLLSKHYAKQFNKKLAKLDLDVIYAPKASTSLAYLKNEEIPVCYATDTTFSQIKDYYDRYSNFSDLSIKESLHIERCAIEKSKYLIFASSWASDHVLEHYPVAKENLFVVKHGANFETIPDKNRIIREYSKTINLLFVGIEWKRKGGDIALDAFKILLNKGYDVTFTVCGCTPPVSHPKMTVIPFLNKNNPAERKAFEDLYYHSHIFFMPTRAECLGIANCEACAYGLPVVSTITGGVPAAVEHLYNGITLPLEAGGADYAEEIEKLINNPAQLKEMAINAREKFEQELNWNVWAKNTKELILKAVN